MKTLSRTEFLMKLARGLLAALLAIIALMLGSRSVRGDECSTCPGKGICRGESDCTSYLNRTR
jgi:hypothetical protein